jgi:hypothetical protein
LQTGQLAAGFVSVCTPPDSAHGQEAVMLSNALGTLMTIR